MTALLLDYRWSLDDAIDSPDVAFILEQFSDLLSKTGLNPGRFIEEADEASFWQRRAADAGDNYLPLVRFFALCRRRDTSPCRATLAGEPTDVTDPWRRGLRDELDSSIDWRSPQIVVARSRRIDWPGAAHLIPSACVPCAQRPMLQPRDLVLAVLENYEVHPHGLSDRDPWDLRHRKPHAPRPYYLPNPLLQNCDPCGDHWMRPRIQDLLGRIDSARALGCRSRSGYYYYIPPATWRPNHVTDVDWRNGKAFPRQQLGNQVGFVDYQGHIWLWDQLHDDHWNVQLGGINNYENVNHLGVIL